jgi:hypothetical protein
VCCQHVPPHLSAARYRSTYTDPGLYTNYHRVLEALLELGQDLSNVPVAMGPDPVLYSYAPSGTTHCAACVCIVCDVYCAVTPLRLLLYVVCVYGLRRLLRGINTTVWCAMCCV